jgi:uncharacterized repeat protein (TIGR01451 family)
MLADKQLGGPGATGVLTATPSNTGGWTGQAIALRGPGGPPPTPSADLAITNAAATSTVQSGRPMSFTKVVTNNGPSPAANVVLSDTVPEHTTFQTMTSPAGWACTTPGTGGTGALSCSVPTLAAGASATFTTTFLNLPASPVGTVISNTASVTSATPDWNAANNAASASVTIQPTAQADLGVLNITSSTAVNPGQNVLYSLQVQNSGPAPASDVVLNAAVPANTTFLSLQVVSPVTWACTTPAVGGSGSITCQTPDLPASTFPGFALNVAVSPGAPIGSTISNTASVTSTTEDPNTANNAFTNTQVTVTAPSATSIAFRAASSASMGGRTLTIARPTSVQPNDVLIAAVYWDHSRPNTITPPAGFSLIREDVGASTQGVSLYYHVAGVGEPASYSWSATLSSDIAGQIAAYIGVDPSNPIDGSSGQTGTLTLATAPSVTTTTDGDWLVGVWSAWTSNISMVAQAGMTQRISNSQCCPLTLADVDLGAAGPSGNHSAFASASPVFTTGQSVALRKAP